MKKIQQYIFILFLAICNDGYANLARFDFQLDSIFQYENIAPFVEVYGDTSLVEKFDYVLENSERLDFQINGRNSLHKGVTNAIWWVRFPLENRASEMQDLILEVANQDINQLQLFVVSTNRIDSSILTGDAFPFEKRPILHRHFLFPFKLKPQEKVVCYLMGNKHSEAFVMPVELWEKQAFLENDNHQSLLFGIYLGILILYTLIAFSLLVFNKKAAMLYYFLLTVSFTLYILATEGFAFQFIWPHASPDFNKIIRPSLMGFQFLFLLLFSIEFLKDKTSYLRILKVVIFGKNIILIILPIAIATGFLMMGTAHSQIVNSILLSLQLVLFFILVVMVILITALEFYQSQGFDYLAIGVVLFANVITFVTVSLNNFAQINSGPNFHNIMLINVGIEITFLSILLFTEYWQLNSLKNKLQTKNLLYQLQIANTLLKGQENERFRINNDLQNQLQPLLTQSQLALQKEVFVPQSDPIRKVNELLQKSQREVNRIANNLIPSSIHKSDLPSSIYALCNMINESKITQVDCFVKNISSTFTSHQQINIYRIIQELLNNIIKHAESTQVKLVLHEDAKFLKITVDDNGIGLEKKLNVDTLLSESKFGALKFRIQSMNGKVHFLESELSGLRVEVILPLSNN